MKKRLLFVNGHMNTGGVEKSLLSILSHLDYKEYEVDLVLFEGIGDYKEQIPEEVNIIEVNLKGTEGSFWKCVKNAVKTKTWSIIIYRIALVLSKYTKQPACLKLVKKCLGLSSKYECAIAYRFGFPMNYVAYLTDSDTKIVWWHHGEYTYSQSQTKTINKTLKQFDKVVFVSECCKKFCMENGLMVHDKVSVIPNIIDYKSIMSLAGGKNPYEQSDKKIIVTISRLSPEKHIENAIYAAEILKSRFESDFKWYIIGSGDMYEELEMSIKKKSLEKNVFLLGNQINPYPFVLNADLYVHTSYVESQGIAVLEAMALGVPCVVTRSLGIQEFAVNEKNALIAEQNVDSLVECITKAYLDTEFSQSLASNAKAKICDYSPSRIIDQFVKLMNL